MVNLVDSIRQTPLTPDELLRVRICQLELMLRKCVTSSRLPTALEHEAREVLLGKEPR